jgi:hypothetical protein
MDRNGWEAIVGISCWQRSIPNISNEGLISLAKDAEYRIGSHVAGGNPVDEYVKRQQDLLTAIQEELNKRNS